MTEMAKVEFKPWMTVNEFSAYIHLGRTYIRARCKARTLPTIMVGNQFRIDAVAAEELLRREGQEGMLYEPPGD